MSIDGVRSFLLYGKEQLLQYEGMTTGILTAAIVLTLLIASGMEKHEDRSIVWVGMSSYILLLVPGICMILERLSAGSLGNGRCFMTVPVPVFIAYGGVRLIGYGRNGRQKILALAASGLIILAGISVPYTFSADNYALPDNSRKVRPEAVEAAGWIGEDPALVPEQLQHSILQMGISTGVLWNHKVVEYNENDVQATLLAGRDNQCTFVILLRKKVEEYDRVADWSISDYYANAYGFQKQNENGRYVLYGPIPEAEPAP